jgi:competence ComEA-like helix-hairpin-helix protein
MSLFILLLAWVAATAGTLSVEVLDVGQGDSILIQTPGGKTILMDAGTGRRNVANLLERRQIGQVDLVVNTHAHADHIGGLDEVLESVPVRVYVDSGVPHTTESYKKVIDLVEARGIAYKSVRTGQVFRFDDGIVMTVLGPDENLISGTRSDLNSNSVITRLDHGKVCFLFMGDAELETEHRVLEHGLRPCQVLKVAHHGSAYASSKQFLEVVQPEWAAISVGRNNRYKHPAPPTVRRLENHGAKVLRTDHHGRIMFESDGRKVKVAVAVQPPDSELPDGVVHKVLPRQAEAPAVGSSAPAATAATEEAPAPVPTIAAASNDGLVDINRATREQLLAIPGIGPAKADAILRYRSEHGSIQAIAELEAVPGIGPATVQKLMQGFSVR